MTLYRATALVDHSSMMLSMTQKLSAKLGTSEEYVPPRFLSRREAAERLRIGSGLLDQLVRDGQVRAIRLRRRVVIPETALLDLQTDATSE